MKRLDGKVAIVTGAGQTPGDTIGNGRATALVFAREGARVLLADRRLESAGETQHLIEEQGGEAAAFHADVSVEDDCRALVGECIRRFGRVDVLHNNVGIGTGDADAADIDLAAWRTVVDVNLTSVLLTCKHALPAMREQGSGTIVNVSSIAAVCTTPLVAYKVSKAGVNALTQQLALANAHYGIRVNAIMPGLINTPMAIEGLSKAFGIPKDKLIADRNASVPLGHEMGTAWDVANAALFLASDEARFITGVVLPVDGGQSARSG
jgi:NAD(P)-dependent dehydrogenase (short-subunit alcohol dehydrogenase family)